MTSTYLVEPQTPPPLNVPASSSTVTVRVIDSTTSIVLPASLLVKPEIKGHTSVTCPAFSFLISNGDRHLLFDLGVRRDWENFAPKLYHRIKESFGVTVEKDVAQILDEDTSGVGVKSKDIEAVIWSHHHWDHTGNVSLFPKSTDLVVGPGFTAEHLPGYPKNPDAILLESDWEGRRFREIDFKKEGNGLKLGRCDAMDFFGDGSFYLLDTPGHTIGHICGLARVTTSPDTFIFMGGDAAHHCGELRPTSYQPLPSNISPSPLPKSQSTGCPGEMLLEIHRNKRADEPFYLPSDVINADSQAAQETVEKLWEFDAAENVYVIIAHDDSLLGQLDFFPKPITDWRAEDLDTKTRWRFLKDFAEALESSGAAK